MNNIKKKNLIKQSADLALWITRAVLSYVIENIYSCLDQWNFLA